MPTRLIDVKVSPEEEMLVQKAHEILVIVYELGFTGNLNHIEINHGEVQIIYETRFGEQSIKRRFTNAN